MLQSHGQPLKKKAPLSLIAWRHTDFAAQNSEEFPSQKFIGPIVSSDIDWKIKYDVGKSAYLADFLEAAISAAAPAEFAEALT